VTSRDFVISLLELSEHLGETSFLTLILGTGTLALLVLVNHLAPRAPAALIALASAGMIAYGFGMEKEGVVLVGAMPSTLPAFS
jgi:MFS superfamily sulfate permease-like transporter